MAITESGTVERPALGPQSTTSRWPEQLQSTLTGESWTQLVLRQPDGECLLCAAFYDWAKNPSSYEGKYFQLGDIRFIFSHNKACSLLGFAWDIFQSMFELTRPDIFECATSDNSDEYTESGRNVYMINMSEFRIDFPIFGYEWKPRTPFYGFRDIFDIEDDMPVVELQKPMSFVRETYDRSFASMCLDQCKALHGSTCEAPERLVCERLQQAPTNIKVVDVQDECIVDLPAGSRYAALSYIWGETNNLQLNRKTTEVLHMRGSLAITNNFEFGHRVPRTILDAMQVVHDLGIRYLWVDSLCIQQDDNAARATQIRQMHRIYFSAEVTLVDAAGAHADAGLMGLCDQIPRASGRVVCTTDGTDSSRRLRCTQEPIYGLMKTYSAPWNTRGWTFQEYYLSRRLLYFTDQEVVFMCNSSSALESFFNQASAVAATGDGGQSPDTPPSIFTYENPGFLKTLTVDSESFFGVLLSIYSQRQLSKDADAIDAIAGVLDATPAHHDLGPYYVCGLPVQGLFEFALLWIHVDENSRRRLAETAQGNVFPSWSWAGWTGHVDWAAHIPWSDSPGILLKRRTVHEWTIEDCAGRTVLTSDSDLAQTCSSAMNLQSGILCFTTACAILDIEIQHWACPTVDIKALSSILDQIINNYKILSLHRIYYRGQWIGSVQTRFDEAAIPVLNGSPCQNIQGEFVLLSGTGDSIWNCRKPEEPKREQQVYLAYDPSLEQSQGPDKAVNVLYVERNGDTCTRRGIGQIHAASWQEVTTEMRHIRLT